jgi:hypothetical protein
MSGASTDPGILELVGELADLLGLAEKIQRYLPTQRIKVQRKHRRIGKLLDGFNVALDDSRAALRVLSSTLDAHLLEPGEATSLETVTPKSDENLPRIAFAIPREELAVYRRGIEQLQSAIHTMTKIAFDLEATSIGITDEVERYYKISQAGNTILRGIRRVLDDHPEDLPDLARKVETYLSRCSQMLDDREAWLER